MPFIDRVKNKIRFTLYKTVLNKFGIGTRVAPSTWEQQFSSGFWDYLYSADEAVHYEAFVKMYGKYTSQGSTLDAGCGQGVLYHYLKKYYVIPEYLGIDISAKAVALASKTFPEAQFRKVDFDKEHLNEKFDVVIFNETLNYFNRPAKKIASVIQDNLKPGGYMMISMCDYVGHDEIWTRLKERYHFLEFHEISNEKGQKWKMGIFKM